MIDWLAKGGDRMTRHKKRPPRKKRPQPSPRAEAIPWTRSAVTSEADTSETGDPYLTIIDEQWDNILMMYNLFADKGPVMLYEVRSQKIFAYPYRGFKADLNQQSQAILERQYEYAQANNQMVLFVRDSEKQVFRSYVLDLERKSEGTNEH